MHLCLSYQNTSTQNKQNNNKDIFHLVMLRLGILQSRIRILKRDLKGNFYYIEHLFKVFAMFKYF